MTAGAGRRLLGLALAGVALGAPGATLAQAPPDALFLGADLVDFSPGSTGGAGSLQWLHAFSPRVSAIGGVLTVSLAGSRWTYGRAGATWKALERTSLSGEANVGAGSGEHGAFTYQLYKAGVTQTLVAGRVTLDVEDLYFDIDTSVGNVVKLGLAVSLGATVRASGAYHTSTSGNADAEYVSGRLDVEPGPVAFFGGAAAGRLKPVLFNVISEAPARNSREFFVGAAFPVGRLRVTVAADLLEFTDLTKRTLTVSCKIPIR